MKIQKIQDLNIRNAKVFLRCDFNVPLNKYGEIEDFKRINSTIETIEYLHSRNCSIIIASHLGRPKGFEKKLSLKPIQRVLRSLIRWPVSLAPGITDEKTLSLAKRMQGKDIMILENLRFDSREKQNDEIFAKNLASMADYYINDAFGVSHRSHASVDRITDYIDDTKKAAGFLMQKEMKYFHDTVKKPKRPFVTILGGSKVSGKLEAIKGLLPNIDKLIIGGAMAFTFLKAKGYKVGKSLVEDDLVDDAKDILKEARKLKKEIILPVDFFVSDEFGENGDIIRVSYDNIPTSYMGLDIGYDSIKLFEEKCRDAKTIFWNGPMGAYEFTYFIQGSAGVANILSESNALTFVGGGDSITVIRKVGLSKRIDFLSTGGGASLQLLEGKKLPGIEKLKTSNFS